jgi:hypothetical protein
MQLTRITPFEPAAALIRFVTSLVERSLQGEETVPSGGSAREKSVPVTTPAGNLQPERNPTLEE